MTSPREALQNLVKTGKLKVEPPDQSEFDGLVRSAGRKLPDAQNAAHSLALAALRWHGFRSENRYVVFQVLGSTASFPVAKWRVLDSCHQKRNVALYDGDYAEDEQLFRS